jgi:mono/diheme cytochrome c family protein
MRKLDLIVILCIFAAPLPASAQEASVEQGRYVAMTAGCNDCHTAGYGPAEGNIPETEWLKGDSMGWRGPWGTTYAVNLRLRLSEMSEDEWVEYAKPVKNAAAHALVQRPRHERNRPPLLPQVCDDLRG